MLKTSDPIIVGNIIFLGMLIFLEMKKKLKPHRLFSRTTLARKGINICRVECHKVNIPSSQVPSRFPSPWNKYTGVSDVPWAKSPQYRCTIPHYVSKCVKASVRTCFLLLPTHLIFRPRKTHFLAPSKTFNARS